MGEMIDVRDLFKNIPGKKYTKKCGVCVCVWVFEEAEGDR